MAIGEGIKICIVFTEPLIGIIDGNENKFTISFNCYNYVPNGILTTATRNVQSIELDPNDHKKLYLNFPKGIQNDFQNAVGNITVNFNSIGSSLMGMGGPIASFSETFSPIGLVPKNNPLFGPEHVEASITASGILREIITRNTRSDNEHVTASITASGVLRSITTTGTRSDNEHVTATMTASGELKDIHDI